MSTSTRCDLVKHDLDCLKRFDLAFPTGRQAKKKKQISLESQIKDAMKNPGEIGEKIFNIISQLNSCTIAYLRSPESPLFKTAPCQSVSTIPYQCDYAQHCEFAHTLPVLVITTILRAGPSHRTEVHNGKCFMDPRICIFLHPETAQLHLPNINFIQQLIRNKLRTRPLPESTRPLPESTRPLPESTRPLPDNTHLLSARLIQNLTQWQPITRPRSQPIQTAHLGFVYVGETPSSRFFLPVVLVPVRPEEKEKSDHR